MKKIGLIGAGSMGGAIARGLLESGYVRAAELAVCDPKVEALRIGREELASLCKAVGVVELNDTDQLHNLPLMVTVGVDRNDPTRNVVKAYKPKAAQTAQAAQTSSATASGTPPWRR